MATAVIVSTWLLSLLFLPTTSYCSASSFNWNLKSTGAFWKDFLRQDGATTTTPSTDTEVKKKNKKKKNNNKVSIDWSGRYECQVTGSQNCDSLQSSDRQIHVPTPTPLIFVNRPPFVQVGFTYDLRSIPGNSLFTKLQWNRVDWQVAIEGPRSRYQYQYEQEPIKRQAAATTAAAAAVLSTHVKLKTSQRQQKQNQQQQHAYACSSSSSSLEFGGNSMRQCHVVARVPISFVGEAHPRIHAEYKALWNDYNRKHAPKFHTQQQDPDWWIPDLRISTSGQLESSNTFSWKNRGCISLRWGRSLGWFGDVDSSTRVRLEVMQCLSAHHSTTATVQGVLEDLPETLHMTLAHQHHF